MSPADWLQLLAVVALGSVLVLILVRAHKSAPPPVSSAQLARLLEIETIARLSETDPKAAERRAAVLEERDRAARDDLWRDARASRTVARRLVRDLERDLRNLRALADDLRRDAPDDPALTEVGADVVRVERSLTLARQLLH
jgi:hypothetical protein